MNIRLTLVALATLFLVAGCLLSGTFLTDVEFSAAFNNGFEKVGVDITEVDHADKIDRVERIDLEGIISNDLNTADTINVYISGDSTLSSKAEVQGASNAYPLILGYVTKPGPGSLDTLTITEARAILREPGAHWSAITDLVKGGIFCIYFTSTGSGASGAVDTGTVIITFTASE